MHTIELIYSIDKNTPRISHIIVQFIKQSLSRIAGNYSQTTDSVTSPTKYTFTSSNLSDDTLEKIKEILGKVQEISDGDITITIQSKN